LGGEAQTLPVLFKIIPLDLCVLSLLRATGNFFSFLTEHLSFRCMLYFLNTVDSKLIASIGTVDCSEVLLLAVSD
jgi:hypothetical protein